MSEKTSWQDTLRAMLPDDYKSEGQAEETITEAPRPTLHIVLDKKRAGKTATIIAGFDTDDTRATELATELKKRLAVGGSSRGGEILLQGDRVKQATEILRQLGWKVK